MQDVRLYILMRADVPTLNPGKAVAQGSHAANQCIHEARKAAGPDLAAKVAEWEEQSGDGFGTCIVLGVNEATMRERVARARQAGVHAGITHDPSYPIRVPTSSSDVFSMGLSGVGAVAAFYLGDLGFAIFFAVLFAFLWLCNHLTGTLRLSKVIPLDTCAYVFGTTEECREIVGDLPLMR